MTLIGTLSEPPSQPAAEAFLAAWTASLPARLEWFRRAAPPHLAAARWEDLDELADVVHEGRRVERSGVEPPVWWPERLGGELTAYGAALADGLTAAVAALCTERVGGQWRTGTDPDDPYFRQPVLTTLSPPPWRLVLSALAHRAKGRPAGLRTAVELGLAAPLPDRAGPQPVTADVQPAGLAGWDLRVSLSEGAAESLGHDAYAALERQLAALPGVVAAMGEDREEFLLRTDGRVTAAAVERAVRELLER